MSECTETAIQTLLVDDGTSTCTVAATIRAREDLDGCGCLECRNIETVALHRTVLDTLIWSVRLFRSYPSIIAFTGVIILANRLLETDSLAVLPTPAVGVFEVLTAFTFLFLIRAYVGTVVAGELTGDRTTVREGMSRSIARIPALVGVIVLLTLSVMTIPFLLSLPLFALAIIVPGNPVEMLGFPVVAAVGGIVFAAPFLLLMFKFWFAPEACVIGRYGPVESLRISWHITTNYRRKLLLIVVIALGSAVSLYLSDYVPAISTGVPAVTPVLTAISSSVGELLSVVWASAYAHIYAQGIVD